MDKRTHGTNQKSGPKLTPDQVRHIRTLKGRMTQEAIADRYGVKQAAITKIFNRTNWGWLE